MRTLKFDQKFETDILFGSKTQTVRKEAKCAVGDEIQLCGHDGREIGIATVKRIEKIQIDETEMFIDGNRLPSVIHSRDCGQTDNEFAMEDGFDGFMEMADWIGQTYGGLPFTGVVIHWHETLR